jgi:hypothetical protein
MGVWKMKVGMKRKEEEEEGMKARSGVGMKMGGRVCFCGLTCAFIDGSGSLCAVIVVGGTAWE